MVVPFLMVGRGDASLRHSRRVGVVLTRDPPRVGLIIGVVEEAGKSGPFLERGVRPGARRP
jgi:hypothetical protein